MRLRLLTYKIYILPILQIGNVTHYDQILSHNPGVDKNIEDKKDQLMPVYKNAVDTRILREDEMYEKYQQYNITFHKDNGSITT